jgi:rod shape-determining protein MreD
MTCEGTLRMTCEGTLRMTCDGTLRVSCEGTLRVARGSRGQSPPRAFSMDKTPGIRPRLTFGHRLDVAARYCFPVACTVLVLLLLSMPLGLPGQAQMQPAWALAAVFFWSLFRPASLPAGAVFAIGLLLDLLAQGPIGVGVLILLLAHGAALRFRRFLTRKGFGFVWLAFMAFAASAAAAEWALVSLLTWRILPLSPALFECGMSIGVYPVLAVLLIRAHRTLAAPERA